MQKHDRTPVIILLKDFRLKIEDSRKIKLRNKDFEEAILFIYSFVLSFFHLFIHLLVHLYISM